LKTLLKQNLKELTKYIQEKIKTAKNQILHLTSFSISHFRQRKTLMLTSALSVFTIINLVLLTTIGAQLTVGTNLYNYGSIETLGKINVYTDSGCITKATTIDWGTLTPGTVATKILYIKNEGNSNLYLTINTDNWTPSVADNYLVLNWNLEGIEIASNQVIQARFGLSVSRNIGGINNFSFNIILTGS